MYTAVTSFFLSTELVFNARCCLTSAPVAADGPGGFISSYLNPKGAEGQEGYSHVAHTAARSWGAAFCCKGVALLCAIAA